MAGLFLYAMLFFCIQFLHQNSAASGPYKLTMLRATRCNQTTYPLDPDPPLSILLEVYNSTKKNFLLRGNITVLRENKQVKLKIKSFSWHDGEWKLMSTMNNIGCHGVLFHTMMVALGLKYDRETCGYLKGKYYFENLDPDMLQHLWLKEADYGRTMRVSETTRGYVTYTCWEFETMVEPLQM